jgi:hypothetical protein
VSIWLRWSGTPAAFLALCSRLRLVANSTSRAAASFCCLARWNSCPTACSSALQQWGPC